jgi:hypothetical protein
MTNKRPAILFYPGDWLRDTGLRLCSIEARGLWMDMICYMHDCVPYGYLKVNHKVIHDVNLASMIGVNLDILQRLLKELIDFGVCGVDGEGCYFSRRMVRDEELRLKRASGGHLGGNPNLKKVKKEAPKPLLEDNHKDNLEGYPSLANANTIKKEEDSLRNNVDIDNIVEEVEDNHKDNHKDNHDGYSRDQIIKLYQGNWTLTVEIEICADLFFEHKEFKNDRDKAFELIKYQLLDLPDDELWERIKQWAKIFNERIESETPKRSMRGKDCWPQHFRNWFNNQDKTQDPWKLKSKKITNGIHKPNGNGLSIGNISGKTSIEEQKKRYKPRDNR